MRPASQAPNRRNKHLKDARALLTRWRNEACATLYRRRPWGPDTLLPDTILTKFATWARLKTPADLVDSGWSPTHAVRHGTELLTMLAELDAEEKRVRLAGNKQRADEKKAATAKRKKVEVQTKALASALSKTLKTPKPRASRAKKPKKAPSPALANVSNYPPATPLQHRPGVYPLLPGPYLPLQLPLPSTSHHYPTTPLPHYHPGPFTPLPGPPRPPHTPLPDHYLPYIPLQTPQQPWAPPPAPELPPILNDLYTALPPPPPESDGDADFPFALLDDFDDIAGPSGSHSVQTPVQPTSLESDNYTPPQPYFFHDQSGNPLPYLKPLSFYGAQMPPQFIPGHFSSPSTIPRTHRPSPSHFPPSVPLR